MKTARAVYSGKVLVKYIEKVFAMGFDVRELSLRAHSSLLTRTALLAGNLARRLCRVRRGRGRFYFRHPRRTNGISPPDQPLHPVQSCVAGAAHPAAGDAPEGYRRTAPWVHDVQRRTSDPHRHPETLRAALRGECGAAGQPARAAVHADHALATTGAVFRAGPQVLSQCVWGVWHGRH